MLDGLREHCGLFGVFGHPEAARLTCLGLHALQHRGQEGAGIVACDGGQLRDYRAKGLVADIFDQQALSSLAGHSAIGHVRYSTSGASDVKNVQPFIAHLSAGSLAIAHNGNLLGADRLRAGLEAAGALFQSDSDTEAILHLVARSAAGGLPERIVDSLRRVQGAYSLLFLTEGSLIAVRDPWGLRPLVLGRLDGCPVVASETCALDLIEAEYLREIEPGELLIADAEGLRSRRVLETGRAARCIFELVYFARPDSTVFGLSVHQVRKALGRRLALEQPAAADLVVAVPDSGTPAALGYAEQAGLPFDVGLLRNNSVGRTFIEPSHSIRHFGVKLKFSAVSSILRGQRVVVVDDSIVRGTTSRKLVAMLRAAGAREVHVRVASPPTAWPCYYGIDTPTRQELIAGSHRVEEIARFLTADSLGYLSLEGLGAAVGGGASWCDACFSGRYLTDVPPAAPPAGARSLEP